MKLPQLFKLNLLVFLTVFLSACSKKDSDQTTNNNQAPTITSLSVSTGDYNSTVVINGTHFDAIASGDEVFFNGKQATVTAASTTQLTVNVPLSAGTGNVSVSVDNGTKIQGPVFTYQYTYFVTTIAGSNLAGEVNGTGTSAILGMSSEMCTDISGNVYFVSYELIRKMTPAGVVTSYVGQATINLANNGTLASPDLGLLTAVTIDPSGNMFIADQRGNIWKVTPSGVVSKFGTPDYFEYTSLATDAAGNIYATDIYMIYKFSPSGVVSTLAGSSQRQPGSANGTGSAASFAYLSGIALDATGNVYVADAGNNRVRKITPAGVVTNLGDADFITPQSLIVDAAGNVYVADTGEALVKKITPSGVISIIAGVPGSNNTQTDGIATSAILSSPTAITIDNNNNLYISDGNEIRRISYE